MKESILLKNYGKKIHRCFSCFVSSIWFNQVTSNQDLTTEHICWSRNGSPISMVHSQWYEIDVKMNDSALSETRSIKQTIFFF